MTLPPLYAPLDPKVAPLVEALRRAGFPTTHSCDGHTVTDGKPWVAVQPYNAYLGITGCDAMAKRLLRWLKAKGIAGTVCTVRSTLLTQPYLRIEVFSDLAEADL